MKCPNCKQAIPAMYSGIACPYCYQMLGDITKVAVDIRKLQRIKIKCRCGHVNTITVPGEVMKSEASPIMDCEACHQRYIFKKGKLFRVDSFGNPEKVIKETQQKANVTLDDRIKKGIAFPAAPAKGVN